VTLEGWIFMVGLRVFDVGALIVWLIQNGLVLLGIEPAWATVSTGAVIIIAVAVDQLVRRQRERRQTRAMDTL
jgi:erythritol transport system permease protein